MNYIQLALESDTIDTFMEKIGNTEEDVKVEEAIKEFTKAIESEPSEPKYYWWRSQFYSYIAKYDEAIKDATKAIELDASNDYYYGQRGWCYLWSEKYGESIQDYTKAIEIAPNTSWRYQRRSEAHYLMNNYAEAVDDYKKWIELLLPEDSDYLEWRGYGIYQNNNYNKDINVIAKLIEENPKEPMYRVWQSNAYLGLVNKEWDEYRRLR